MREKKIVARPADGILKEKWPGVNTRCSDIIKLPFEKKMPYTFIYFKAFRIIVAFIVSENYIYP